jgi:hypothetical protein
MYQLLSLPVVKIGTPDEKRKRKVSSSKLSRLNARIKLKLKNSSFRIKGGRRNFVRKTYFSKYVLRKRSKYRRTFLLPHGRNVKYKIISKLFKKFRERARLKNPRYLILRRKGKLKPILPYRLGLITVRRKHRNFFATIHKYLDRGMIYDHFEILKGTKKSHTKLKMQNPFKYDVVFKSTVGQTGYKGPKRKTQLGTKRVGKACAFFLRKNKFTAYDLVFSREFSKRYTFFIKGLTSTRFWVRRIFIPRRHSHGFTRKNKHRR